MTIPSTSAPPNVPGQTTGDTKESMKETAATAADQGKHVASVAQDEAKNVLDETKTQARTLLDDAQSQLEEQTRSQRDRIVSTLQTFGQDLEKMASGQGADSGMAQDLLRQVSSHVRDFTSRLDGQEPQQLLTEVRSFARRRPGTFLVGAVAAGMVAGRMSRGAIEAKREEGSSSGTPTATGTRPVADPGLQGTATGAPLAGTPRPHGDPVSPEGTSGSGAMT
ncbi:MAG TPA: hypothetical protein VFK52_00805 [Nocardioidaceae bacterium]|nr:hypothetical protein [Nocardioidaceae bacterium]